MTRTFSGAVQAVVDNIVKQVYGDLKIESTYNMQNCSLCSDVLERTSKTVDKLVKVSDDSLKTIEKIDALWRPLMVEKKKTQEKVARTE